MSQSTVRSPDPACAPGPESGRLDLLGSLATQALSRIAHQVRTLPADPDGAAADQLHAAAIGQDLRGCGAVARALIAEGMPAERICDVLIPDVACRLGEEWVTGDRTFSTVTIAVARLQALLREFDLHVLNRVESYAGTAGAVLVAVPPGADHTLGPLLLASQLRRRGVAVRLSLGEAPESVAEVVARMRFDAVFLSGATGGSLPLLIRIAAAIRDAVPMPPQIVLGGVLVGSGEVSSEDPGEGAAKDRAGRAAFDHVTCDLDEAMRLCGLGAAR